MAYQNPQQSYGQDYSNYGAYKQGSGYRQTDTAYTQANPGQVYGSGSGAYQGSYAAAGYGPGYSASNYASGNNAYQSGVAHAAPSQPGAQYSAATNVQSGGAYPASASDAYTATGNQNANYGVGTAAASYNAAGYNQGAAYGQSNAEFAAPGGYAASAHETGSVAAASNGGLPGSGNVGAGYAGGAVGAAGAGQGYAGNAARCSWQAWPSTRSEATQVEVPVGLLYTPFSELNTVSLLNYEPIRSRSGGSILNPFCHVDFRTKVWSDPFTLTRNALPQSYAAQVNEQNLCVELMQHSVEYVLSGPGGGQFNSPTFLFVIDVSLYEEELDSLKDALQQILQLMPQDVYIGIITFGSVINIYELGFNECIKSYVFKGNKSITPADIQQQLKILPVGSGSTTGYGGSGSGSGAAGGNKRSGNKGGSGTGLGALGPQALAQTKRFLAPISEAEFIANCILEDLQTDSWPVAADCRASRCTGAALSAAVSLLELCAAQQSARILLFTGGICTSGPGQTASLALADCIRQHLDIQNETASAKYTKSALAFYKDLALRSVNAGHAIDLFCCSLDQTGLYEMRVLSERTGGVVVMSDTFSLNVFQDSLKKLFEVGPDGYLQDAYNVKVEILPSKELKVCGAIGACTSTNKKGLQVSDLTVGQCNTSEWAVGVMDRSSTLAFYLEVVNLNSSALQGRFAFLQFQVTYTHHSGQRRCRVTTLSYPFSQPGPGHLGPGFDQEAAAGLVARLAVAKTENEESLDILRWVDRKLIRLVSVFAEYEKDKPETFQLGSELCLYPCFMYHLRRSHFLQSFNISPDEQAYYRHCLLRDTLMNIITMIQPSLYEYNLNNLQPIPVELDSKALKNDVVLLLDSFFHVVVWHGEQIVKWKMQGYHEQPKFLNLKTILELPIEDAKRTLKSRLPCPKFVVCNAGGSQARFLLAKVNPSSTHALVTQEYGADNVGTSIITDDVSLKVFMEHLIRLATSS